MAFNVLTRNRDDHAKNRAILVTRAALMPRPGILPHLFHLQEHALQVGSAGGNPGFPRCSRAWGAKAAPWWVPVWAGTRMAALTAPKLDLVIPARNEPYFHTAMPVRAMVATVIIPPS